MAPCCAAWKRNKSSEAGHCLLSSSSRNDMEEDRHHGLRVADCCRESGGTQPRSRETRHHQALRYSASRLNCRLRAAACRTDLPTGNDPTCPLSGTSGLDGLGRKGLPGVRTNSAEKRVASVRLSCRLE